jgi:EpsI family protein
MMNIFSSMQAKVLTGVLLTQAVVYNAMPNREYVPTMAPLETMPRQAGDWNMVSQSEPEQEVKDLLKADDALTRIFARGGDSLSLFVAFFRTQRAGVVPHSPRVCLPGSGWTPSDISYVDVTVPGRAEPMKINRYVVTRGEAKSIVYYWFQSPHHIVASEIYSKFYLVMDSLRYQRSDTSIVRVVMSVDSRGEAYADKTAIEFIKQASPIVTKHLPS